MSGCDLKGAGILVTRAVHQAESLARLIEERHGRAVRFPAIEIQPGRDSELAQKRLQASWDWMIFVSPNAVRFALKLQPRESWQSGGVGAVGATTARWLQQAGQRVDLLPSQRYDSEGLLSLPELTRPRDKRILIVRGEGGRALLGDTLEARGAKVRYAEVYRRVKPDTPVAPLLSCWPREVHLVTVTSNEVLKNLVAMLGESGWPVLSQTPLMVISERMLHEAQRLGFNSIIQVSGADDQSLLGAICDWAEKRDLPDAG
jgi:uroporphyrinogen-III synthase